MDVVPFDVHRMFIGEQPPLFLLEIAFRTLVMYSYTLFAARFIGKRGVGQITPFEFVVIIVLGSAVGDPMLYDDVPLTHGMLVVTVVVIMEKLLNAVTNLYPKLERVMESESVLLLKDGEILTEAMKAEGLSEQEFFMQLRMEGVRNTGEVERAYLEPSGSLSVFRFKKEEEKEGVSTFPEYHKK